jgi:hypothetical protein
MRQRPSDRPSGTAGTTRGDGQNLSGFVIVLEGHTPHKEGLDFLWPPEVGLDRRKWGFFNQLCHLGKTDEQIIAEKEKTADNPAGTTTAGMGNRIGVGITPGVPNMPTAAVRNKVENTSTTSSGSEKLPETDFQKQASARAEQAPFMCYTGSEDLKHDFDSSQSDWITIASNTNQPNGLGIFKTETITPSARSTSLRGASSSDQKKEVLIDPFTLEPISETYKYDANGNIVYDNSGQPDVQHHDYWFRIKFKVKLKNPPQAKI